MSLIKDNEVSFPPGEYRDIQNLFKQIARKAMLDKEYRALCLQDSQAAIQQLNTAGLAVPPRLIFSEDGQETDTENAVVYQLPPYLKVSWLLSR